MIVGIVVYRNFHDYERFKKDIDNWISSNGSITTIVSGGASGTDALAVRYANEHKIDVIVYPADWKEHGKRAGPMRNTLIVDRSEYIVAFLSKKSRGTLDTINKAKAKGIPVTVLQVD